MDKMFESQVAEIWQRQLLDKTALITEDGRPLEVVYPGRPNDDRGADFRDAVISTNHTLLRGDIEVHVRSNDWHSHGHDSDTAYNRVILHVVMWHSSLRASSLQNGGEVPILALKKYLRSPTSPGPPCAPASPETIAAFLDRSGDARFQDKTERFRVRLCKTDASQVLYEGIMEALGYVKNKQPFLEIARRLPLKTLESISRSNLPPKECLTCLQASFHEMAGMLNGWNTFKIRPYNSPSLRLAAMSRLLVRYRERGLLKELTGKLELAGGRQAYDLLERAFMVVTVVKHERGNIALLGRERAAVIAINVLLPFSYAWGQIYKRTRLMRQSLDLYRHYPKQASNSIERHMAYQLGLNSKLVDSARRQQGLIHIYKSLCTQGLCGECALSQPHSGQHVHI